MTDWATRASTPENPIREMQSPAPAVDDDATIAAIRRILCDQEHLLPPDVTASLARRWLPRRHRSARRPSRGPSTSRWWGSGDGSPSG